MNKKLLAVGVTTLVFAGVPVVGAFAATGTTVSDSISITVNESCTIGSTDGQSVTGSLTPASVSGDLEGSKISITCNAATGWELKAKGAGTESHTTELWNATANKGITTGTTIDESHTAWGFKVSGTGAADGYTSYAAVPAADTVVASSDSIVTNNVITVNYKVSNSGDLPVGTYTGKVTYTLTKKAGGA